MPTPHRNPHALTVSLLLAGSAGLLILAGCGSRTVVDSVQLESQSVPEPVADETVQHGYDDLTRARAANWCRLMDEGRHYPEAVKVRQVNDLINQAEFIWDAPQWGRADYWATPYEVLETNRGDCEDFVIAKYYTLKQMGVAEHKLRFVYARSLKLEQPHMVLAYLPDNRGEALILDILDKQLTPVSARGDLVPVYSFNASGVWLADRQLHGRYLGSADRLSVWRHLRQRLSGHDSAVTTAQASNGRTPVGLWRCRKVSVNTVQP
jgi:predicted transglutaminase-like cysteine proteinase